MAIEYFNWFNVFVNELAGGTWMFLLIAALVIAAVGSYYRMPWKAMLMMFVTFFVMFSAYTGDYWIFLLLGASVLLAIALRKLYQSVT